MKQEGSRISARIIQMEGKFMKKHSKSRLADSKIDGDKLNSLLERATFNAMDVSLPDIAYLPKRRDAIHLKEEDMTLLQGGAIAILELSEEAVAEMAGCVHSLYGTLEHDSPNYYFFTVNDLGLSHFILRFKAEAEYREIFERLTCEPIDLKLIGEIDDSVFYIKGYRPVPNGTFDKFCDEIS